MAELDQQITDKENQVSSMEGRIEEAQADLDKQYEDMKTRIQYMYENDQTAVQNIITAALTGGLTGLLNQVEYTVSVNQYDRNMLENYKVSKADLDDQYAKLQDEQDALELLKTETEKKKQQVADQQAATGSKLSEYEKLLAQKEGEITDMAEFIKEKTDLLNQLIAKAAQEEAAARIRAAQQAAASMNTSGNIQQADSGISGGSVSLSDYEIMMLATIIYCEAGNQGTDGQLAVGYVIMNRIRSSRFPNTLEGVLRQSKQFEPVGSGRFDLVLKAEQDDDIPNIVTQSCWNAARAVVNGTSNVGESLFFRTWAPVPSLVTNLQNGGVPYWIIKDHIFYYYWTSYTTGSSSNNNTSNDDDDDDEDESEDIEDDDTKKDDSSEKDSDNKTPDVTPTPTPSQRLNLTIPHRIIRETLRPRHQTIREALQQRHLTIREALRRRHLTIPEAFRQRLRRRRRKGLRKKSIIPGRNRLFLPGIKEKEKNLKKIKKMLYKSEKPMYTKQVLW